MRRARDLLLLFLAVLCAGYWFGNSGTALAVLWWEARRRAHVALSQPPDVAWLENLLTVPDGERLSFVYLGSHRVVLIGEHSGRCEVFRDEVPEQVWVRLRRRCLAAQPATGLSTSI